MNQVKTCCLYDQRRHRPVVVCMPVMHVYTLWFSHHLRSVCEMELVFAAAIVRWAAVLLPPRWRLKWQLLRGLTRCESSCSVIISTTPAWPLMNPLAAAHLMLMSQLVMLQVLSDGNMICCKNSSWSRIRRLCNVWHELKTAEFLVPFFSVARIFREE